MISTFESAKLGVLIFSMGDIVEYNPTTDAARLYFGEDNFTSVANINEVHLTMRELVMVVLLRLGCLVLIGPRRR